jgi:hypothetical protein
MAGKRLKKIGETDVKFFRTESARAPIGRITTVDRKNANDEKPVSLAPLSFEEAPSGLLKARPSGGRRKGSHGRK